MISSQFEGGFNNFQQYWKENTEDEMHKNKSGSQHRHLHFQIKNLNENSWTISVYEGREHNVHLYDQEWKLDRDVLGIGDSNFSLLKTDTGFCAEDESVVLENNVLRLNSKMIKDDHSNSEYVFYKCRYFSGWIQYPPDHENPDDLFSLRDLQIHDQGGIAEIPIDHKMYTVELTQLVFAHTIFIMKLAIYDVSIKDLDINTKSISYTWTDPDAKRIGLNLRHIISGWTYIEPGFINSNNLKT